MCTLTWLRRDDGYELFSSRDELVTRLPGLPPTELHANETRAVAPTDADAGGTWIAASELGLALVLLNGEDPRPPGPAFRSRGHLIPALLDARTREEALARAAELDLARTRAFRLAAFDRAGGPDVLAWDGAHARRLAPDDVRMPLLSAPVEAGRAAAARRATFAARIGAPERATRAALLAFHASHEPERGALSVCMHRAEAGTRSLTHVVVASDRVTLATTPGPPCEGGPWRSASIPARRAWTPLATGDGSLTLVHPAHGEACHAREGAWTEAVRRYAGPCELRARALAGAARLRLLDVGTGLGLNLAAALAALEGTGARLHAVGLEADREVLEEAVRLYAALPAPPAGAPWEPWHGLVRAALAAALATAPGAPVPLGPRGTLRLLLGDAREELERLDPAPPHGDGPPFDAVFLDPFSPRREPELWTPDFLAAVARRMAPGAVLSTFSAARAVRAGLAAAGLGVAAGPPVGRKREGTLARKAPAPGEGAGGFA